MSTPWVIFLAAVVLLVASWWLLPGPWARALIGLGRRAGELRSRTIAVDGTRWHYLEGGRRAGEAPTLLCVHGFGADADHWVRISRRLGQHFHLVCPDLPGFGDTPTTDDTFSAPQQAQRLAAFLDAVGVEQCWAAGSSMGGWVVAALAQAQPGRIDALWLVAPLGVAEAPPSEVLSEIDAGGPGPLNVTSTTEFRDRVFRPMFVRPPWLPGPMLRHLAGRGITRLPLYNRMIESVRRDSPTLEEIAADLDVPVLVQWGDGDRVTHPAGADALLRALPEAELQRLPHCGHLPMLEQPTRTVTGFLAFAGAHRPNLVTAAD